MNRRIGLVTAGLVVALVAGGGTALAVAADGPVSDGGVISGCYTNAEIHGTHAFVLQDSGTNCPAGTTAVSWNQQGPPGPAGANGSSLLTSAAAPSVSAACTAGDTDIDLGDGEVWSCNTGGSWYDTGSSIDGQQGVQGPPGVGTAGPDGLDIVIITSSQSVGFEGYADPVAYCPAAEPYVLSGGGEWSSQLTSGGPYLEASIPIINGIPVTGPESSSNSNGWSAVGYNSTGGTDTLSVWVVCSA